MGDRVYYMPNQREVKTAENVFALLGISPKILKKRPQDVILYVQWGYSKIVDDIAEVRNILAGYPQVKDDSTIYILAMSKHDNSNIHIHDCVHAKMKTEGNITFFELHVSHSGEIHKCRGNNNNKNLLLRELEQVKQEESMSDCVHYIPKHGQDINPGNITDWLGITPKLLLKNPPVDSGNNVILYVQRGFCGIADDISVVRSLLPDYPQVTDTSSVYILAMSTYDDANRHIQECVHANSMTEGNIIFLEIHCSHSGQIYNCKGNNDVMDVLRPKLKVEELTHAGTNITYDMAWTPLLIISLLIVGAALIFKPR